MRATLKEIDDALGFEETVSFAGNKICKNDCEYFDTDRWAGLLTYAYKTNNQRLKDVAREGIIPSIKTFEDWDIAIALFLVIFAENEQDAKKLLESIEELTLTPEDIQTFVTIYKKGRGGGENEKHERFEEAKDLYESYLTGFVYSWLASHDDELSLEFLLDIRGMTKTEHEDELLLRIKRRAKSFKDWYLLYRSFAIDEEEWHKQMKRLASSLVEWYIVYSRSKDDDEKQRAYQIVNSMEGTLEDYTTIWGAERHPSIYREETVFAREILEKALNLCNNFDDVYNLFVAKGGSISLGGRRVIRHRGYGGGQINDEAQMLAERLLEYADCIQDYFRVCVKCIAIDDVKARAMKMIESSEESVDLDFFRKIIEDYEPPLVAVYDDGTDEGIEIPWGGQEIDAIQLIVQKAKEKLELI